jgi:hypothetical protein
MIRTNIPSRCIASVLLILTALPATTPAAADDGDGPEAVLDQVMRAHGARDVDAYAALLTEDFRFHFGDEEQRALHPDGWGKADELAAATHLFIGDPDRPDRPPARRIELSFGANNRPARSRVSMRSRTACTHRCARGPASTSSWRTGGG